LNTTRHRPSASRRQIELNVPIRRPEGSRTGPLLNARLPEASTSTDSGSQEKGAAGPSKYGRQPSSTAALRAPVAVEHRFLAPVPREGRKAPGGHGRGELGPGPTDLLGQCLVGLAANGPSGNELRQAEHQGEMVRMVRVRASAGQVRFDPPGPPRER
jgi:hypothetical protein